MAPSRAEPLRAYVQHQATCAKWTEPWEWPQRLHQDRACTCGLDAALAGPQAPSGWQPIVVELSSTELARIFEDIKIGADHRAAWDALSDEDRYTLYLVLVDEVRDMP